LRPSYVVVFGRGESLAHLGLGADLLRFAVDVEGHRRRTSPSLLVQVRHGCAPGGLDVTLARKLGQVCPPLGGVVIGLLAVGVGALPGDGLVVEIRRVPAEFGGQLSTQTLVRLTGRHYSSSS
jgi:hypothetical protein